VWRHLFHLQPCGAFGGHGLLEEVDIEAPGKAGHQVLRALEYEVPSQMGKN
jgi:hypothetical protein